MHFGFIALPTNLRVSRQDPNVPSWNVWNDLLPPYFFNSMGQLLADDGFLAVLSMGENFDHRRKIFDAATRKGRYKIAQSYSVILSSPLYKVGTDIQVTFFIPPYG